jgi:hypothetical protein
MIGGGKDSTPDISLANSPGLPIDDCQLPIDDCQLPIGVVPKLIVQFHAKTA